MKRSPLYDAIAADPADGARCLRDLARMRAAYILVDKLPPAELISRLGSFDNETEPLAQCGSRNLRAFGLSHWRLHHWPTAILMTIVADHGAAPGLRQRAQTLLNV